LINRQAACSCAKAAIMAMQSQFGTQLVAGSKVTYVGPEVLYEATDYTVDGKGKIRPPKILHQGMEGRVVAIDKNRPQVLWEIPDRGKYKDGWTNEATDDQGKTVQTVVKVTNSDGVSCVVDNTANWERANAVFVKGDRLHHRVLHHEPQEYKDCGVSTVTLSGSPLVPGDEVEYVITGGDRTQQAYAGMVGRVNKITNSGHAQVNFGHSGGEQDGGVFVVPRRLVHHGSSQGHQLLQGAQGGAVRYHGWHADAIGQNSGYNGHI